MHLPIRNGHVDAIHQILHRNLHEEEEEDEIKQIVYLRYNYASE